jgi:hypothetical protein
MVFSSMAGLLLFKVAKIWRRVCAKEFRSLGGWTLIFDIKCHPNTNYEILPVIEYGLSLVSANVVG